MEKSIKITAVWNGDHYHHFNIHPTTASLYGDKVEDIETVTMKISDDQSIPKSNVKLVDADYWGWYDERDKSFSMLYPQRFLVDMCFPAGIKRTEEVRQGKAYRLEILKAKYI